MHILFPHRLVSLPSRNTNLFTEIKEMGLYEDADYDYLFKITLTGDSGVSKTNLGFRFSKKEFSLDYIYTTGIDFSSACNIPFDGKIFRLQIRDTSGKDRYHFLYIIYTD